MIWRRYFLKEIFKVFFLFLSTFFFLYAALDYSTHMQDFIKDHKIQLPDILLYYSFQFIKRADLLLPLALLLATIKVLSSFNSNRELVALQTARLSLGKLLTPFFFAGALSTLFNYASFEYLTPYALNYLDTFRQEHFRHTYTGKRKEPFHVLHLNDHSKLVYQYYDPTDHCFFDAIWIRSSSDIWRIKRLNADPALPEGRWIDHLVRTDKGYFEKQESFDRLLISELVWQQKMTQQGFIPFENRSLSALFKLYFDRERTSAYAAAEVLAHLLFKSVMPLHSLLVVLAAAPFCTSYARSSSPFMLYALALFGFLAFFTLMDAAVIVAKNHILHPAIALLSPFACLALLFGIRYQRRLS